MKYTVRAVSIDLTVEPNIFTEPRDEVIDTETNRIFEDCVTIRDVEIAYEDFWNYLNGDEKVHDATSKIKVMSVTPIND